MTLKMRAAVAVLVALVTSATAMVACGGPTTTEIIQTTQAENRNVNATRTAEAAGSSSDPIDSAAARSRATFAAGLTATAEAQGEDGTPDPGSSNSSELPYGDMEPPDGPAESGEVTVNIAANGIFEPEIVKVTVGTTVTWENSRRSGSSSTAFPGQDESWDSGSISQGTFATEPGRFSYTFNTPGCFQYRSTQSGESTTGAVCVVE